MGHFRRSGTACNQLHIAGLDRLDIPLREADGDDVEAQGRKAVFRVSKLFGDGALRHRRRA